MLGIIGGTGLYQIDGFSNTSTKWIDTPFGKPSAEIVVGELAGQKVAFLPRHGIQHQILPSEINYRANIWALKAAGVKRIISVSAVGSLRENIRPGDLVMPNQYFDWTKGKRVASFFGAGLVGHVSTANPTCPVLAKTINVGATKIGCQIHWDKTYACIEGPRLGTRAESLFLRHSGCDLVGMTNVPEVFLAREAQLCYCTIAVATDFDSWMNDPNQHATVDKVIELYKKNIVRVQHLLRQVISESEESYSCECRTSLKFAVLSDEKSLTPEQQGTLAFLRE